MAEYIFISLILLATIIVYRWIIKPKRKMAKYAKHFRQNGYKVLQYQYNPLGAPQLQKSFSAIKEKGDAAYYEKHVHNQFDVIISNILNTPVITFSNEKLIKEGLGPDKLMCLEKQKGISRVYYSIIRKGMLHIEGDDWKNRRKVISQVFNFEFIASNIPMMSQLADNIFKQFEENAEKVDLDEFGKKKITVDFYDMMVKYTSSVVLSGFLGLNSLKQQIQGESIIKKSLKLNTTAADSLKDPLLRIFGQKLLNQGWRKFDKEFLQLHAQVNAVIESYIEQCKKNINNTESKKHKTIVQLLLNERNKKEGTFSITDEELRDQIKTFMIAGSETTSNLLVPIVFFVFQKPEVSERLKKEIKAVIKSDEDITIENFKKLSFLDCIILQTSRLFCTVPRTFHRSVNTDISIGGVQIQKGTTISFSWMSIFFNPEHFENAYQFVPERWEKEECKQKRHLVDMIFSGGPRSCIGKNLALTETKVMLIKLIKNFDTIIEHGVKQRAVDLPFVLHMRNSRADLVKGFD